MIGMGTTDCVQLATQLELLAGEVPDRPQHADTRFVIKLNFESHHALVDKTEDKFLDPRLQIA